MYGDLSELAQTQRGHSSIKCAPTASSYDDQQDAAPYKSFTRSLASTCFHKKVCIFCNGDNSEETLHEVTCTEVTMIIKRSSITGCQRCQSYGH